MHPLPASTVRILVPGILVPVRCLVLLWFVVCALLTTVGTAGTDHPRIRECPALSSAAPAPARPARTCSSRALACNSGCSKGNVPPRCRRAQSLTPPTDRSLQKHHISFPTFPMSVPSLPWQMFGFLCNYFTKWQAQKREDVFLPYRAGHGSWRRCTGPRAQ